MFWGRWNTKVDEKWRIYIPRCLIKGVGNKILLQEDDDGCIIIKNANISKIKKIKDFSEIFLEDIKNGGRIKIPETLRKTNSFYFGKNITIVGRGDYLKILPRP